MDERGAARLKADAAAPLGGNEKTHSVNHVTQTQAAARAIAGARVAVGTTVIGILLYTYVIGIPRQGASLFDYFGYFTNLTCLLSATILIVVGVFGWRGRGIPRSLHLARGVAVACMIIVALVYNLVVPGTGSAPAWVSATLHVFFPALLLLDWVLVADRPPLPWQRIWIVLPYPLLWLTVTLIRGASDGWVPYGFLLPEREPAQLTATVAGLLVALLAAAALTWAASRLSIRR